MVAFSKCLLNLPSIAYASPDFAERCFYGIQYLPMIPAIPRGLRRIWHTILEGHLPVRRMLRRLEYQPSHRRESRKSQISKYGQQTGLQGGSINLSECNMIKFYADWLEKFSVGAMLVGMFQNNVIAFFIGVVSTIAYFKIRNKQ